MLDGYLMSDREFERSQLKSLRHPLCPRQDPDDGISGRTFIDASQRRPAACTVAN
jgi:hypothetical protein